jgi:hypothetical protein
MHSAFLARFDCTWRRRLDPECGRGLAPGAIPVDDVGGFSSSLQFRLDASGGARSTADHPASEKGAKLKFSFCS